MGLQSESFIDVLLAVENMFWAQESFRREICGGNSTFSGVPRVHAARPRAFLVRLHRAAGLFPGKAEGGGHPLRVETEDDPGRGGGTKTAKDRLRIESPHHHSFTLESFIRCHAQSGRNLMTCHHGADEHYAA